MLLPQIVNACGVEDFHDGVNYMRTACVIAVTKGRDDLAKAALHAKARVGQSLGALARRWR